MGLNTSYIPITELQGLFRDKTTGLPLRSGVVSFYKDTARNTLKTIYKLVSTGTPPVYSYEALPNPLTLTAIGTLSDGLNNDIIPYLFPYETDGTTVELYYVTVVNSGAVPQFTREGIPNVAEVEGPSEQDVKNYIPNGQFLLHNDIPAEDDPVVYVAGEVRDAITYIGQGGWTFERSLGTTADDFVTFVPYGAVTNPTGNPRYAINIRCASPGSGDDIKDLRVKFDDVNKFASATQEYTFAITAKTLSGSTTPVDLILIKDFGTGGDTETAITLTTFDVDTTESIHQYAFAFGTNIGKTIGTANDDYLQLALRLPVDAEFEIEITDAILTFDDVTITEFPATPDAQFIYQSLTPPVPAYDGSQLYLTRRLTAEGEVFDDSEIGDVIAESQLSVYVSSLHPTINRMLADGAKYETVGYSPLGIPFSRLQAKYWDITLNGPQHGTGDDYFTAINDGATSLLRITNNTSGLVTNIADGAATTGFTFATIHAGANYYADGHWATGNHLFIIDQQVGVATAADAHTSGFTITEERNNTDIKQVIRIDTILASGITGGDAFYFSTVNAGVTQDYYMWFTVDGAGADPAPGGRTGIKVDLLSTYTSTDVAKIVAEAASGYQLSTIVTVAASALNGGDYFTVSSTGDNFYVWYTKDGAGTDPAPANKTAIKVAILSADTAAQVAAKTQIAINMRYFKVPDYRGYFLRGWDSGIDIDPDRNLRWLNSLVSGDNIGTAQWDEILQHNHILEPGDPDAAGGTTLATTVNGPAGTETTVSTGGAENRPINKYVNYVIKY